MCLGYLGPTAPSESWLPASLGVPADLAVGDVGGGTILEKKRENKSLSAKAAQQLLNSCCVCVTRS